MACKQGQIIFLRVCNVGSTAYVIAEKKYDLSISIIYLSASKRMQITQMDHDNLLRNLHT